MKIEAGIADDISQLEKLYNDVNDYLQQGVNFSGWAKGVYPTKETAEIGINEKSLFCIRVEDKIAGSIILNHKQEKAYDKVAWGLKAADNQVIVIHTLVVHPKFMKQGIAHQLIEFAKGYAIRKSAKTIRLDVAVQNSPAISLYEKCGYVYVGTVDLGLEYEHLKWFKLYELIL